MSTNFGSYPLAAADSCEGLWLNMLLPGTFITELSFHELGADRDTAFRADKLDCGTVTLWVCGAECWGEHAKTHYDHMILNPLRNLNPRNSHDVQLWLYSKVQTRGSRGTMNKTSWWQMSFSDRKTFYDNIISFQNDLTAMFKVYQMTRNKLPLLVLSLGPFIW